MNSTETLLNRSIRDLNELITDINANHFIPKKFRRAPFTELLRKQYLNYLNRELRRLNKKLAEL